MLLFLVLTSIFHCMRYRLFTTSLWELAETCNLFFIISYINRLIDPVDKTSAEAPQKVPFHCLSLWKTPLAEKEHAQTITIHQLRGKKAGLIYCIDLLGLKMWPTNKVGNQHSRPPPFPLSRVIYHQWAYTEFSPSFSILFPSLFSFVFSVTLTDVISSKWQ